MEPHFFKYIDHDTQLRCVVIRTDMGHYCGYVKLPKSRTLSRIKKWKKNGQLKNGYTSLYNNKDISSLNVHGGITYAGNAQFKNDTGTWVGFDCAHYNDAPHPMYVKHHFNTQGVYRDFNFVINELTNLAKQIKATFV